MGLYLYAHQRPLRQENTVPGAKTAEFSYLPNAYKPSVASGEAATESQEAPKEATPAAATPKKPAARRGSKRGRH